MGILRRRTTSSTSTSSADSGPADGAPSFGYVFKILTGIAGGVMTAAIIGMGTFLWNVNNELTTLRARVESQGEKIKTVENLPTIVATMQALQQSQQTVQQGANVTLANRMDNLEREQKWRDRTERNKGR